MSCGEGHRRGLDLALMWLRYSLAAMVVIQPLAWELPYAAGTDLNIKKTNIYVYKLLLFGPIGLLFFASSFAHFYD